MLLRPFLGLTDEAEAKNDGLPRTQAGQELTAKRQKAYRVFSYSRMPPWTDINIPVPELAGGTPPSLSLSYNRVMVHQVTGWGPYEK